MTVLNRNIAAWALRIVRAFQNTPLSILSLFMLVFMVSCAENTPKNAQTQVSEAPKEPINSLIDESTKGILDSSKKTYTMKSTEKIAVGLLKK